MKNFCKELKEHITKIVSYETKMTPLTIKENKSKRKQKVCYKWKKEFSTDDDNKKYYKVRNHCPYTGIYRGAAHNICNLRYKH